MLLLNFCERPKEEFKKKRRVFKKKNYEPIFKRERVIIGDKSIYILSLSKSYLDDESFKTLLKSYKGKVIVEKENQELIPEEFLYKADDYYCKALLSSLIKRIKVENVGNRNVLIKLCEFHSCEELFELVMIAKRVVFCFGKENDFDRFYEECYNQYGSVVRVLSDCRCANDYNFFLDLTEIDYDGKAQVLTDGVPSVLYPDNSYFRKDKNTDLLSKLGIDFKIACAVINT